MSKKEYFYNHKACQFQPVVKNRLHWIKYITLLLLSSITCGLIFFFIYGRYFSSPKELELINENRSLITHKSTIQEAIKQLKTSVDKLQKENNGIYQIIFETKHRPSELLTSSKNATPLKKYALEELEKRVKDLKKELLIKAKNYNKVYRFFNSKKKKLIYMPLSPPLLDIQPKHLVAGYGNRFSSTIKLIHCHTGIDFTVEKNTPVYASGNGYIHSVIHGYNWGKGNQVIINHGYGYTSVYNHLEKINVFLNQMIKRGQQLGTVGNTGSSVVAHLHYEILYHGKHINPIYYLLNGFSAKEYESFLHASTNKNQSLD